MSRLDEPSIKKALHDNSFLENFLLLTGPATRELSGQAVQTRDADETYMAETETRPRHWKIPPRRDRDPQ